MVSKRETSFIVHPWVLMVVVMVMGLVVVNGRSAQAQLTLPPNFERVPLTPVSAQPVAIAFAPDGRLFVAEKAGVVRVYKNGQKLKNFINLKKEVNASAERGLMGIALDPNFMTNRYVYLLYNVDPVYGQPDEPDTMGTFSRIVRYKGKAKTNGNTADLNSRKIIMGKNASDGIPGCYKSHVANALMFGPDNRLYIAVGDSAKYEFADGGGQSPECFTSSLFPASQDIGAFRAQSLNSLAGKILRVKKNGKGVPNNPFWNGNANSIQSKIWATGLRNPWRMTLKPGSAVSNVTIYVGDVGWNNFEEVNAVRIGENHGWPCYEGPNLAPAYPGMNPASGGCATIGSSSNPGPLKGPSMHWHRQNAAFGNPSGVTGRSVTGGVFHQGNNYPEPFRNSYFVADFMNDWIMVAKFNNNDVLTSVQNFATGSGRPVDFAIEPGTGDVAYISWADQRVYKIRYTGNPSQPLLQSATNHNDNIMGLLANFGACSEFELCPDDLNADGVVDEQDLAIALQEIGQSEQ